MSARHGRRGVGRVERFLEEWNRQLEVGKGEEASASRERLSGEEAEEAGLVKAISLRRTGYMSVSLSSFVSSEVTA